MRKILCILAILVFGIAVYVMASRPDPQLMEYRVTAQSGDTIWGICRKIVTDRDDLSEVVWRARLDSGIDDAADLQPGQIVIVKVREVE